MQIHFEMDTADPADCLDLCNIACALNGQDKPDADIVHVEALRAAIGSGNHPLLQSILAQLQALAKVLPSFLPQVMALVGAASVPGANWFAVLMQALTLLAQMQAKAPPVA